MRGPNHDQVEIGGANAGTGVTLTEKTAIYSVRESRTEPSMFSLTTGGKSGVRLVPNPRKIRWTLDWSRNTLSFERWGVSIKSGLKERVDRLRSGPSNHDVFSSVSPKFCAR